VAMLFCDVCRADDLPGVHLSVGTVREVDGHHARTESYQ